MMLRPDCRISTQTYFRSPAPVTAPVRHRVRFWVSFRLHDFDNAAMRRLDTGEDLWNRMEPRLRA